jgi:hypothetical protein
LTEDQPSSAATVENAIPVSDPAVRERLEELAKTSGSLSAAVEKAIMAIPH